MTTTDTATAARIARVSVATVRAWCRFGSVSATKSAGRWVIDADSLGRRVTLAATLRAEKAVLDLSAFRDATAAREKAVELIEQGAIIPGSRPGLFLATSTDGANTYVIDAWEPSCTCKGHVYTGRCFHRVAAALLAHSTAA